MQSLRMAGLFRCSVMTPLPFSTSILVELYARDEVVVCLFVVDPWIRVWIWGLQLCGREGFLLWSFPFLGLLDFVASSLFSTEPRKLRLLVTGFDKCPQGKWWLRSEWSLWVSKNSFFKGIHTFLFKTSINNNLKFRNVV